MAIKDATGFTFHLLEETNASGAAQADYIYLDGRLVAVLNSSTLYYLHDDMLGTPQLATDSNLAHGGRIQADRILCIELRTGLWTLN
jgi:hypothetical protein